ncbi:ABC-type nickel/cobalt efflux system, permease component RcnA [Rhizobiales bacterium GAS188]|nr:ABC-type nickel/cobalt efflux system, permease component RcnA [Rhizobiales bacterium GAS188]
MTLVAAEPKDNPVMLRCAVALVALLLAALVVFGVGMLVAGTAPAAPKSPFGVGIREAAQGGSDIGRWLLAQQEWFYRQMADTLKGASDHNGFALGMVLLAFGYGIFHAGGPGHGKAVISAYLIANERALWRGVALSTAAALLQALVAIAIVFVAHFALRATAIGMTQLANRVELVSFAAIALYGLVLTWRKAAPLAARLTHEPRAGALTGISASARLAPHEHVHDYDHHHDDHAGHDHGHEHHAHAESHAHDHDCCDHHVPVEFVQSPSFRWRDAVPVVIAAGSRPCSGAIIILVFALSQGLVAAGLAAVFAMAIGVAITVGALAILSVFAKRLAQRFAGTEGRFAFVGTGIELFAAAFVAMLGLGLMSGLAMISAG